MALNINYRAQLLVGLIMSVWLYFFLVLIGPFDAAELSLKIRTILMLGYGLLFFLCYAILIPIQNKLYHYWGKWKLGYEIAMVTLFCLYCLPICFAYYKTEAVNGLFSFGYFALAIYLPTIAILTPVIFVGRYLVTRNEKKSSEDPIQKETVTLLGDNKLDILKLPMTDLVALEAANNYVAVYYLLDGQLKKKLLRTSLRKIHKIVPEMIQVHRSYLVNLQHFVEWKDGLSLVLTQFTVPVSQKYKSSLLAMPAFSPK
ncbi:MAG: LytTR family DNA-binding domain-containing protein [Bacteroidia bacterium]